jgi:hypothetical protein
MEASALVEYLRTYGPIASSESLYDEHVLQAATQHKVQPLEIESPLLGHLLANFKSDAPYNVILTGTAGDGKTWHARKIFSELRGTKEDWAKGDGLAELRLPSGNILTVVKDLSQFHEDPRQQSLMEGLLDALLGRTLGKVYLVAANDGQLLRFWRNYSKTHPEAVTIGEAFSTMLKDGTEEHPDLRLLMYNLSQRPHDDLFERAVEAIEDHSGWADCNGCGLNQHDKCPIRSNLAALTKGEMRRRLRDMIQLAAANDTHLPMRHVLLLTSNIILGVSGKKSVLMDCATAKAMVAQDEQHLSNPYDNALGLNLRPGENKNYLAFTVFENAGIGHETNNAIDGLLIDQLPKDFHDKYVANDPIHGAVRFEGARAQYRRGDAEDFMAFQRGVEAQRRRLFFTLPSEDSDDNYDPWRLSVFIHGGNYLKFAEDLREGRSSERIKRRLVVGINRSFSGMMCEDDTRVWFTSPAANTQSRIGRVLDIDLPLGGSRRDTAAFDFAIGGTHNRPQIVITVRSDASSSPTIIERNPLQPLLFEYLMRVQGGSLPGSFSRQCFEEMRQFRLRVIARLTQHDLIIGDNVRETDIVRLDQDGRLRAESIGVA